MKYEALKAELAKKFPNVWIKDGMDFDNGHDGTLWTGEGSSISVTRGDMTYEVEAFNMYAHHGYTFGVINELDDFLTQRGWHAEAYDAGTFFLYNDNKE